MYYTCRCIWRPENTYISEALAHAYKLHIHDFFFPVGTFGGLAPPPPNSKKLATLLRESPLPHPPLGVPLNNRNGPPPPTPCTEIIYIWRLFGARVDVNSNLIMHKKPVFSTPNSKNSPPWEGISPPTPSPLVTNTLFNKNGSPSPLARNHIHFELDFMLIQNL